MLRELTASVIISIFYFNGVRNFLLDYIATGRLTSLCFCIFAGSVGIFTLIRRFPKSITKNPLEWLVAIVATIIPTFLHPSTINIASFGIPIQLTGLCIVLAGLVSLNRSFAIVPANRGIKTNGMYRAVRHPLYAGYCLSDVGLLLNQFSYYNAIIVSTAILFLILRIHFEESLLREDPEYLAFCNKTRYRLIPFIW